MIGFLAEEEGRVPANLSPEYRKAQDAYRRARDPKERLDCLREMLRTIPKHKGTEHLQADIKTRIKELSDERAEHKKAAGRGPSIVVRTEGAAQVALVGPPNSGKSSLHARLTGSHAVIGPYPFATKLPLPGMLTYQDIHFQLVDLPPIAVDYLEPWVSNALENADGALLVVDLSDADCVEQVAVIGRRLEEKRVTLGDRPEEARTSAGPETGEAQGNDLAIDAPFRVRLPTVLVANKSDRLADPEAELEVFCQLSEARFPSLAVSAETGYSLDRIAPLLFEMLGVVRVYTKVPGHAAQLDRPFTLHRGSSVRDVARLVHRGRAAELKFARLWGRGEFDGRQVSPEHPVLDRDVVELHW